MAAVEERELCARLVEVLAINMELAPATKWPFFGKNRGDVIELKGRLM